MTRHLVCLFALAATSTALIACGEVSNTPIDAVPSATLIVTAAGDGTVTSTPAGISCGADCSESFTIGTSVTLTAAPAAGATFQGWSGGGCTGLGTCVVTIAGDTAITATFAANPTLTVATDGTGMGMVTSAPAGITCGSDCTESYPSGTVVTLTATADASANFAGWGGACTGTAPTCAVTLDQARSVTATFTLNRYALAVTRAGSGSGSVASTPAGIDCGADCTEDYDHGTAVTLTATPAVGSTFLGWTGGGCTGTADCVVTLTAVTTVTATFSINQDSLTVMRAGNGTGTVTSSPAGINCGADCTEIYNFGTVVTLTATPAAGSTFAGWSGACTGTGPCMTTITGATGVTATFTLNQYTLTVTRAGTGTGTVTSSPAGINCGADCTEVYNHGTAVVLTAAAAAGSTVSGWSGGGCTGTGTCTTTITAATSVTATFTLNAYTLTVTRAGTGTGTVTSSPAGINCGADCTEVLNHGTMITLTAAAAGTSTFAGWSGGGCTGTGTCVVTMTAATTVTATFNGGCATGSATFNYVGSRQTFTVPACVTSIRIDARGAQGGGGGALGGVGGLGARAVGTFAVAGGAVITIQVGGAGLPGTNSGEQAGGSGGGGTFVVSSAGSPLIVAGGGGGAMGRSGLVVDGGPGLITPDGAAGQTNGGAGGVRGNGGTTWPWTGWHSGTGGGGFYGDGVNNSNGNTGSFGTINTFGRAYVNGGAGGTGGSLGRSGGYGGGGAAGFTGGGGGGFSGGGSGSHDAPANPNGGGGGSYNAGTAPSMTAGFQTGNGQVIITW